MYRFVSGVIVRKESLPESEVATSRSLPSSWKKSEREAERRRKKDRSGSQYHAVQSISGPERPNWRLTGHQTGKQLVLLVMKFPGQLGGAAMGKFT